MTQDDIDALVGQIDGGDYSTLPIFADAIEDAPDGLLKAHGLRRGDAAGLRRVSAEDKRPDRFTSCEDEWIWYACDTNNPESQYFYWVPKTVIGLAVGHIYHKFPTISAALIFLARKYVEKGLCNE